MGTISPNVYSIIRDIKTNDDLILREFYTNQISLSESAYSSREEYEEVMRQLIAALTGKSISYIIDTVKPIYKPLPIETGEIPQFSDLSIALYNVPAILHSSNMDEMSYEEMGKSLWGAERDKGADLKYGENQAKTASQIGLAEVTRGKIRRSDFGDIFLSLNPAQQALLIPALWLKVPLFQNYFLGSLGEEGLKRDISILSESTQKRRLTNIRTIIDVIKKGYYLKENVIPKGKAKFKLNLEDIDTQKISSSYLRALRTKPFLLLAGISGTGKSRIVKQMAFDSCPNVKELREDPTSPGNYCLIEVKPNWHDSTELLGYESKIGGASYQLTTFIKFLVKAMCYPEVPFFVCLDEMNLAPVEQYFAEFLSVLESRTKVEDKIISEPLIKGEIFSNPQYERDLQDKLLGLEIEGKVGEGKMLQLATAKLSPAKQKVYDILKKEGLRIPENVVVIGTVNMDETTHQFSRKVIDRAMTIEMNLPEGDPFMDFFANTSDLSYRSNPTSASLYLATETKAKDVIEALSTENAEDTEWLKGEIAKVLTALNNALDGTPFKVAYRVQNELLLYFYQLWLEDKTAKWREILNTSVDQILMMKVLPRVEGDEELLEKPLDRLIEFAEPYTNAKKKLIEMKERLQQSRFASFWP